MIKRLKVTFGNDNRMMSSPKTFAEFSTKVKEVFSLSSLDNFNIYYMDSDGDLIIVTNQDDYELAFEQADKKLHFYIGTSTEKVKESIVLKPAVMEQASKNSISKCDIVQSEYAEDNNLELTASTYNCLGCDGKRTNKKGNKVCRICSGTGKVPQTFIEKLKEIARSELMAEISSRMEITRTQIEEKKKAEVPQLAKPIPQSVIYKIETSKNPIPTFKASNISESLKDGYKTTPGTIFEKVWVIKNTGTNTWPQSTEFKMVQGDPIEATADHVGAVKPGEIVNIKVIIKAPQKAGRYASFFKLTHSKNITFGEKPWIDFIVE